MRLVQKLIDRYYNRRGFPRAYDYWLMPLMDDFKNNKATTFFQKLWAYKRGFLSDKIDRYGLTEETYKNNISERDYQFLYPINNLYAKWVDDKLTFKYILHPFNEYLPKYYYHILSSRGCRVISLSDLSNDYGDSFEDVLRLLRDKGDLAVKFISGSCGDGFYKFSYREGKYYINEKDNVTEDSLISLMKTFEDYVVTQYVHQHHELARLYSGSLNSIRLMVVNENGNDPRIIDGYIRIGSKSNGVVDNIHAENGGGMFAYIDVDTGELSHAHIVKSKYEYVPCAVHPDSGAEINGVVLPHWELIVTKVLEISRFIPQLEWMGFDVGITEDGFEIHEINTLPGFVGIYKYLKPETVSYLKRKLESKKIVFNIK